MGEGRFFAADRSDQITQARSADLAEKLARSVPNGIVFVRQRFDAETGKMSKTK
jgi:hypothetical protein